MRKSTNNKHFVCVDWREIMARILTETAQTPGEKVRQVMREHHCTQAQLAEELNCSENHVSMIVRGKRNLTVENAKKISKLFCVRFEWLLGFDEYKTIEQRISAITKKKYSRRDSIHDLISLHGYEVNVEKVLTVEKKDSEEEQLEARKKALAEWSGSSCRLRYPPGISDDDILERAHNTSPEPVIAVKSPSGAIRYIEGCEYENLLKSIDDYIEMQLSFLFRNPKDGAKEYWG